MMNAEAAALKEGRIVSAVRGGSRRETGAL